ncbi:hypothetical protein [Stakelama pacifica]|uniref:HNH endonuclease n=1 Tax=Stakelama pacifica TaxID=517720 RepID=A0A4R6FM78_9SPHN|nr:hypothetical protein [Stakelama pacifica]TDN81754.1 hypothetical protein EV664_107156 [Stakelama pacifica]GGO96475.1 hypothetical protein GCM10011329_23090 [Stakelama pacifica]
MKMCGRCAVNKPVTEFRTDPRYRDGHVSWCKQCHRERNSEWARQNRERLTAKSAAWRASNLEKARETNRSFKRQNCARLRDEYSIWAKANRGKRNAASAKYKASKLRATPPWANLSKIAAIYERASAIQAATGQRMHVDHIVPLQHELVCGLHCETNLQILPGSLNEAKRNNWSPEDAQRQGNLFAGEAA